MNVCIVQPRLNSVSETFIRAHAEYLPADVTVVHGHTPHLDDRPLLSQSLLARASRKATRILAGRPWEWEYTLAYLRAFRKTNPDVVLAEYGPTGVAVQQACEIAGIPLVVHFHGYDASQKDVLAKFGDSYKQMFRKSAAVIAGCTEMATHLIKLGAPAEKVVTNFESTVDISLFTAHDPGKQPPRFLSIGRFVEKKAPHFTLLAFAKTAALLEDVELVMIGEGILLDACQDLAKALGVDDRVTFLGSQPHKVVRQELAKTRCFVQHSIIANNGDREGTAISVLEAAAAGVPIIATRHQGIAETMIDGETALLVDEFDINGMADCMVRIASNPQLATRIGEAARKRVSTKFTMEICINGLYEILIKAVNENRKTH